MVGIDLETETRHEKLSFKPLRLDKDLTTIKASKSPHMMGLQRSNYIVIDCEPKVETTRFAEANNVLTSVG